MLALLTVPKVRDASIVSHAREFLQAMCSGRIKVEEEAPAPVGVAQTPPVDHHPGLRHREGQEDADGEQRDQGVVTGSPKYGLACSFIVHCFG